MGPVTAKRDQQRVGPRLDRSCRDGGSVSSDRGAQPLAIVQQQLGHFLIAAVRFALAITEEDFRPRRDARDFLANDLARARRFTEAVDQLLDVTLGCVIIAWRR